MSEDWDRVDDLAVALLLGGTELVPWQIEFMRAIATGNES